MENEKPIGRPSGYKPEMDELVYKFSLLGAKDIELAQFLEICVDTLNEWKKSFPSFSASIKAGKENADANVGNSLYRKANGYEFAEEQAFKLKEVIYENGKKVREVETLETVMVNRIVPPDTVACIFWLKNRRKKEWRDKVDIEASGGITITVEERRREVQKKAAEFLQLVRPNASA